MVTVVFGMESTSMKKLSVFGAFRFSEFRIRDWLPVVSDRFLWWQRAGQTTVARGGTGLNTAGVPCRQAPVASLPFCLLVLYYRLQPVSHTNRLRTSMLWRGPASLFISTEGFQKRGAETSCTWQEARGCWRKPQDEKPHTLQYSLEPGRATLSPNSPHHIKTKKLGCSIERLNILKYTVPTSFFQNL
jgi:hypothetical protein